MSDFGELELMNLFKQLKVAQAEVPLSKVLPITHLMSESIFATNRGFLGSVLQFEGIGFTLESPHTLNQHNRILHQALVELDSRFMVYAYVHRKKKPLTLDGDFSCPFAKSLNDCYMSRFQKESLYRNELYVAIILKGDSFTNKISRLKPLQRFKDTVISKEQKIALLTTTVHTLKARLEDFKPTLLKERALLNFLSLIPNAGSGLAFEMPTYAIPIASNIPRVFKEEMIYPEGHLSQYLSRYQLLFGEYIQFQGNTKEDVRFASMLTLKKYPTETSHALLDLMLSLDCELIMTSSFAPIERDQALKQIAQKRNKLMNVEDKALSQFDALVDLEDAISGETDRLGAHHHTIMLIANHIEVLDAAILEATRRYSAINIPIIRETPLSLELSFLSQIPGNQHLITRASLITAKNFVDFTPLHNTKSTLHSGNHLPSPITILETPEKSPVFFHYHSEGSKTNPSKGHTAIFGGNNAGKTTLVNFLDAQMGRFKGRSFYIDRDESSKIYILASENTSYTKIAPQDSVQMNPLRLKDTVENRSFLKLWFQSLMLYEGELILPADIAEMANDAIDYALEHLSDEYRTLSHISQYLAPDFPRWPELKKWLKGNQNRIEGEYAWLFDNEDDELNLDFDKVGFDVTYLMDKTHTLISTPVYLYLVHRMQLLLDGRLTSFVIDEAWQLLASPFWVKCLSEWLPTIRKKNGHFIFMTQSPKTISLSPIKHVVLDNLASLIIFPNNLATKEIYIDELGLTKTQFKAIQSLNPASRLFLYKQGHDAMLCKLDLNEMKAFVSVLSGNTKSIKREDALIKAHGAHPKNWLKPFMEESPS